MLQALALSQQEYFDEQRRLSTDANDDENKPSTSKQ